MSGVGSAGSERPAELLLECQGLHVAYGAIQAVRGVSLSVRKGEVVALIGRNGAGKTSLLRAVSGMLRPADGRITLEGKDITGMPSHLLVARGMAHAPEGRGIFPNLTVEENLGLGAWLRTDADGVAADEAWVLSLFPRLKERWAAAAGTLSGGEQQMLAISRALMSRPRLLLLDEPSLGLAPQVIQLIFRILADVNGKGVSILLVEQNAHLALNLAGHAYVLETGEVAMEGAGKALLQSEDVRRAYLGE
ncbi:MAG: ABC transporter ATP-binding protein [Deltaproteobacteria bacterium]|nr:ABC transporter ATP-binding protein [Deltaproteobacteria bacterium]